LINHKPVAFQVKNGFAQVSAQFKAGDVIEYSFQMKSGIEKVANVPRAKSGYVHLYYGPLLLGHEGNSDVEIPENAEVVKTGEAGFQVKGKDIALSPVYHLLDVKVCKSTVYRKQIIFEQTTE
jgi:DUF1680 family protein